MAHIFLVEDDQDIAKNLRLLLELEGFTLTDAATQKESIQHIEGGRFDLALLDLSLPDGSGFSVYTAVKEKHDIPIIFLTATEDELSVVTGLNMGADDYIIKPFRPRELVARIRAVLRKRQQVSTIFAWGNLQVDTANGLVEQAGKNIQLSALEYRLLLIFINNPRQILTRDQILEELWDAAGDFVNDNTLTVYIKRLREKVEVDPLQPQLILTVRGRGYKLGEA